MKNLNSYYNVAQGADSYLNGLEIAKKDGYTYLYRWVNSDLGWTFFAKSYDEAYEEAVDLYMSEKNEKDRDLAESYYHEYVDIIEIDQAIKDI